MELLFEFFTKIMTTRVGPVADRLISLSQSAFIKGRFILESVVSAHEIIHEVHRSHSSGLVLKLDYEKAYDHVNWEFLDEMLVSRGFGRKFRSWISSSLVNGSFCVRTNDQNSEYFVAGKGLKQGDPLSPILFNFVAEVFTKTLAKAASHNLIKGLLPQVVPGGIISLQYADDTILFLEPDMHMARILMWILTCFENLSGMRINYHKSDLFTINLPEAYAKEFAHVFCCNLGSFPFKYLGVPLNFAKLRKEDLQPIIDHIIRKITGWRGKIDIL
jgi:hypothetical protein